MQLDDFDRLLDKESRAYVRDQMLSLFNPAELGINLVKEEVKESEENKEVPKMETLSVHWSHFSAQIEDAEIVAHLQVIRQLSEQIGSKKEELDTEEHHRFERLEETVLPNTLASFCVLTTNEQTFHKLTLIQSLAKAKELLLELEEKQKRKKEFVFQRNAEILNNI